MIARVAYDVHIKDNLSTRTLANSYKVPYVVNTIAQGNPGYGCVPDSAHKCNGVLTSRNIPIYPNFGSAETSSYTGMLREANPGGQQYTIIHATDGVTFDFFDPSTNTFVPWTLYTEEIQYSYYSTQVDGLELRWKDQNGNNPPSISGITNYIARSPTRYRIDSLDVLLGFDGFAFNPFSETDPIVAKLCIQYCTYHPPRSSTTEYWVTSAKYTGCRFRNAESQTRRCMPYQYRYSKSAYGSVGYNISDPVVAKAIAFGMTNWVKLHDDFKEYLSEIYTETVPEFEYEKYLEFGNL